MKSKPVGLPRREKKYFYRQKFVARHVQSIDSDIRSRFIGYGRGWVFTPKHFQDLGSSIAIDSTLRRLRAEGVILQLARGLYDYPAHDRQLGMLTPIADAIARALVVRDATIALN
jgi:hypothetical protein